jgi:hypothetical protein
MELEILRTRKNMDLQVHTAHRMLFGYLTKCIVEIGEQESRLAEIKCMPSIGQSANYATPKNPSNRPIHPPG